MDEQDIGDGRVDTRQHIQTAPFRIPRPWEKDAPMFTTESIDELVDFLDTIIELGHVGCDQERKAILTGYLPVSMRSLCRGLNTYNTPHSYTDFRTELVRLYPDLGARESGSLAGLEKLCLEFKGVGKNEDGRLRRFGRRFCLLVEKLQQPYALVTNRDACTRYLRTLDPGFANRVCRAVEEREIARVLLQQLGIKLKVENGVARRKEDVISLREMVQITEAIARTDISYLHSDETKEGQGEIPNRNLISMDGIQNDEKPNDPAGPHCAAQNNTDSIQGVEVGLETSGWIPGNEFNDDEKMKSALAEISALTQYTRNVETFLRGDSSDFSAWCSDQFVGLWQETAMFGDELGGIHDELQTVQRQLMDIKEAETTRNEEIYLEMDTLRRRMQEIEDLSSRDCRDVFDSGLDDADVLRKEIFHEISMVQGELHSIQRQLKETRECVTTRDEEIHLEIDVLGRHVHEIQYSSLQDLWDVFDGGRDGINALREGIFNELGMVQDELRTIQTRLRHTKICGNTSIEQARMNSEKAFLLNWMKEERGGGDTRVATRNDKNFEPLLTNKQKAALQRG
ncbi:hypothetical protein B0H13DRAFT_2653070 [Mycena leptocephala]|nr:hypothetical protein B0H13DRAFT_2653070 [Mycena leptocephala]